MTDSPSKPESMKQIASEISGYLKTFEASESTNKARSGSGHNPYFGAGAWSAGRYIGVKYVSYQGTFYLTRSEGEQYLAFLRQGGVGKHALAGIDVLKRKRATYAR